MTDQRHAKSKEQELEEDWKVARDHSVTKPCVYCSNVRKRRAKDDEQDRTHDMKYIHE